MATKTPTCEVEMFACVDTVGDYGVGKTPEAARESYENDIQSLSDCDGFRIITLTVTVPLPTELSATLTASPWTTEELSAKEA